MSAQSQAGPFRHAGDVILTTIVLGAIAAIVWAIVYGASNQARGDYAGFHYGAAESYARSVLVKQYGLSAVSEMRFAKPPVVNTHLDSVLTGTGQVRIFHVIGPRGVRYCVGVWNGGNGKDDKHFIVKGCNFNTGGQS